MISTYSLLKARVCPLVPAFSLILLAPRYRVFLLLSSFSAHQTVHLTCQAPTRSTHEENQVVFPLPSKLPDLEVLPPSVGPLEVELT